MLTATASDDIAIEVDEADFESAAPAPADDNNPNNTEAPWTPEVQRRFETIPLVVTMKKLVARELADTRQELRRTLRGVRRVEEDNQALRRELRLEQALSDAPDMTPARRSFLRQLHAAEQPEDAQAWIDSTLAKMTPNQGKK